MSGYVGYLRATGDVDTRAAIVTCPTCTYLKDGSCVVCQTSYDHPSCSGCENGEVVWYRKPFFVSVASAVVISLVAGVAVAHIRKHVRFFD